MNKLRRGFLALAVIALVLTMGSCTWILSMSNSVAIDGESYPLSQLILSSYGQVDGVYTLTASFLSEGISYSPSTGFNGSGTVVSIGFIASEDSLAEGDYASDSDRIAGAILLASVVAQATYTDGAISDQEILASMVGGMHVRKTLGGALAIAGEFDGVDETERQVEVVLTYRGEVDQTHDNSLVASMSLDRMIRRLFHASPAIIAAYLGPTGPPSDYEQ